MRWQLMASSLFGVACFVLLTLGTATAALADGGIDPIEASATCVDNACGTVICCTVDPDPPATCATNVGGIVCNTADSDCKCKTSSQSCVCWK